jgi:hypothetical protein
MRNLYNKLSLDIAINVIAFQLNAPAHRPAGPKETTATNAFFGSAVCGATMSFWLNRPISEVAQYFRVCAYLSKNVRMLPSEVTEGRITCRSHNGLWPFRLIKSVGIYRLQCHSTFTLILSSHPRLGVPNGSLLAGFPSISIFHFSHTWNFSRAPHPSFDRPNIWRRVKSMNLLSSLKYLHFPVPSSHLGTKLFPPPKPHSELLLQFLS